MKLRKALDKAKQERENNLRPAAGKTSPGQSLPGERANWLSPTYSQSKTVTIIPQELEENRCTCICPEASELEAYKVLRTQIQQRTKEQGWKTIMITSVRAGEGKTLTAINLAITMAKEFHQTVMLVDGDLRKQGIHERLGYESKMGLADYLLDDTPLAELIVWPGIEKLTVISGGKTLRESTELLGSPKMKELVTEMKGRYEDRYILFDVPPLLQGADAIAFAPYVDSILVAVESGKTSMADVKRALTLIPKEKVLGFILNRHGAAA